VAKPLSDVQVSNKVAHPVLHPKRPILHKTTYHTSPMIAKIKGNNEELWSGSS